MRVFIATTCIVAGSLLAGGCATKKYVRNTTAPIQAKVDQVGQQTTQNTQQIDETKTELKSVDDKAQRGISAAQERAASADQHAATADQKAVAADQKASTADQHAGDALNRANQVGDESKRALRTAVENIDDYQLQTTTSVPFGFAKYALTTAAKEDLDQVATAAKADKRFLIAIEGYTDKTGSKEYNEMLSKKRADAVVEYLVAKHEIPVYRIHVIGLADARPVDEGNTAAARAKNRRVEVKLFTADQLAASLDTGAGGASRK